jgi:short-subunit dehydrogenase
MEQLETGSGSHTRQRSSRAAHRLENAVVVITGASSGLGRAAAHAFAKRGCRLVLAARRERLLEDTAAECRAFGANAMAVRTDVTNVDDVEALARKAHQMWGRIDVWINNAGVTMFGLLHQGRIADHLRVIDTNLFGAMHAARAILPIFINQRAGTLINVASIVSKTGQAFVPAYAISKFGLRGLSETLRMQLADFPDVHVCTLLPYAIDTPHFESGANITGRAAHAMQPIQSPEQVADALVGLAQRPRRELHVPRYAVLGFALHWLWPRVTERLMLHSLQRFHLAEPEPPTEGALFQPLEQSGSVHGSRPPLVTRSAFAMWSLREVVSIVFHTTARWLKPLTTRS